MVLRFNLNEKKKKHLIALSPMCLCNVLKKLNITLNVNRVNQTYSMTLSVHI